MWDMHLMVARHAAAVEHVLALRQIKFRIDRMIAAVEAAYGE